ncbi:hypothetical protein DZF91_03220 [Actinomadura logoneensis]|uniref:Uncharacterized protein n=1 Tax=Actinomadura logoneensis TaxID=2293572 RepID=A0A372JSQ7_9ACTN|nr:hypothetical protein [Actinomadura logoneensis]RFU43062.1 hypothetical protein DZF91_03220 [Actinomadura logoneensis]
MAKRTRHTMTKVRWTMWALGALVVALTFAASSAVTVQMTVAMGVGLGVLVLAASEWIIARTRNHPQVRMAEWRAGIDR